MTGAELFSIYRTILVIIFGSYAVVRTASFAWNWHAGTRRAGRSEALLRRYLFTAVLRVRFRRFWKELIQILALAIIFVYLVGLNARRSAASATIPNEAALSAAVSGEGTLT
jgi:hypothetical protein